MDISIAVSMIACVTLVFGVAFFRLAKNHPSVGGLKYWAWAAIFEFFTLIVVSWPVVPYQLAVILGGLFCIVGVHCVWLGVGAHLAQRVPLRIMVVNSVVVVATLCVIAPLNVDQRYPISLTLLGIFVMIIGLISTLQLASKQGSGTEVAMMLRIARTEGFVVVALLLAVWAFVPFAPLTQFRSNWFYGCLFVYAVDTVVRSVFYFLLVGKRLQRESDDAKTEALKRQAGLRALMHNLSAGVLVMDPNLRVEESNREGQQLLNFAGMDLVEWHWLNEDGKPLAPTDSPWGSEAAPRPTEFQNRVLGLKSIADGRVKWFLMTAYRQPEEDSFERRLTVLTFVDVTSRKQSLERGIALEAELAAARKMEAIGRLTSGIAHDFSNALMGVSGWMSVAKEDGALEHPGHEAIGQAEVGLKYAQGLVRQLMMFSRQERSKLQTILMADVISQACDFVRSGLIKRTRLVWVPGQNGGEVLADAVQLQQVLVNLLINASHEMKGGGEVSIELDTVAVPDSALERSEYPGSGPLIEGQYRRVRVHDAGPGIDPELLEKIFEPFFTTKLPGNGTGLGLAVAHGVMTGHGGAIGVTSKPGEGACFHLYLPVPAMRQEGQALPAGKALPDTLDIRTQDVVTGRLLFVDDDLIFRGVWIALLERHGWQITTAPDGQAAWQLFTEAQPGHWDVVLTDIDMPQMDGVELAQKILATPHAPPVLLMSAHMPSELRTKLAGIEFTAMLDKGMEFDEMRQELLRAMAISLRRTASESAQASMPKPPDAIETESESD